MAHRHRCYYGAHCGFVAGHEMAERFEPHIREQAVHDSASMNVIDEVQINEREGVVPDAEAV